MLTILQYPASHQLIRRIKTHLEPQIQFNRDLDKLRGPLEPFAKAHRKAQMEASGKHRHEPAGDWRQRRKQARDQAEVAIGLYQVEDLVF